MRSVRSLRGWGVATALALLAVWWQGPAPDAATTRDRNQQPAPQIPSLSEPGESLTIRGVSDRSGLVTFAAAERQGILVSVQANAPTETRARSFIGLYGAAFGITDQSQLRLTRAPEIDAIGIEHIRFQQLHHGVPVAGADLVVHLRGSRVRAVNGRTTPHLPAVVTPRLTPAQAIDAARQFVDRRIAARGGAAFGAPRLEILDRGLLDGSALPARLAWYVEARGPALRQRIWVDAESGGILLSFNQMPDAKTRKVFDSNQTAVLPGTLVRSEGEPATGAPDVDSAYDFAGLAYDYFFTVHGRDSYDGAGAEVRASVNWNDNANCPNAFWDGTAMIFCAGFAAADDIVAHEFTHGVTDHTADLFYYYQAGALSESYSDVFGESVDLANGGDEGKRWQAGEDLPGGALRHMMNPNAFGHPAHMNDPLFWCGAPDNGGVHINSGVPNHAYALMVDGGSYNGHTIAAIGRTKADRIQFRALTVYLTSGATFADNHQALLQSCTDLTGTGGITASDCTQVRSALDAVQMDERWKCTAATVPAPLCASGAPPASTTFSDDFEAGLTNWTAANPSSADQWVLDDQFAESGTRAVRAVDPANVSDQRLTMNTPVLIPAGARLAFDHSFGFDASGGTTFLDGGVIEYSTDGATWVDAGSLIDGGQTYRAPLAGPPDDEGNPLAGRPAFADVSYGYTNTRLNLAALAGQSIRFRFRLGSGSTTGAYGWVVDNVQIYTCAGDAGGDLIRNGTFAAAGTPPSTPPDHWLVFSAPTQNDIVWNTTGGTFNFLRPAGSTQAVVFQQTGVAVQAFGPIEATFTMATTDTVRKRFSVLIHNADFSDLSVCTFWLEPSAPARAYAMRTHTTRPWTNATISFYAATAGSGGMYQLDSVSMRFTPSQSPERTDCVDPVAPSAGGVTSGDLLVNGGFAGGTIAPWTDFGEIAWQLTSGVFEFFKLPGTPSGVLLQKTGQPMTAGQKLIASVQLGNSSGVRQRVTLLLHDDNFSDLHACTFVLAPGLPLSTFSMRTYATEAWTDATISVYPSTVGDASTHQWLRFDNAVLVRTNLATTGTECFEPGDLPG